MKRTVLILVAIPLFAVGPLYAEYTVENRGAWPESWPSELEPLRESSRTLEGPLRPLLHYAIPFTKREEFEAAWPNILKVKSQGAPIILKRGPSFWFGDRANAGVCVHTPPAGARESSTSGPATRTDNIRVESVTYIELIVDGEIVDLNRIPLPRDTPIIDQRFEDARPAAIEVRE